MGESLVRNSERYVLKYKALKEFHEQIQRHIKKKNGKEGKKRDRRRSEHSKVLGKTKDQFFAAEAK
jgi:hypothetical protein